MKRFLCVALVLALGLATTGLAKKRSRKEKSGGYGWFGPSVMFVDYKGINDQLAMVGGFEELNSLHWAFGGGGHAHIGRIVLGGSGWGGSQTVASESMAVRVDVGGGQFEAGYSVLSLEHLIITPMLGIGASGYEVTVEETNYPGNFQEFLRNHGPSSSIAFDGFILAPMLMVNIPVKFVGIQLRGGYAVQPGDPVWKFPGGGTLLGGPDVAPGYPFAGINVSFGGIDSKRKR